MADQSTTTKTQDTKTTDSKKARKPRTTFTPEQKLARSLETFCSKELADNFIKVCSSDLFKDYTPNDIIQALIQGFVDQKIKLTPKKILSVS